MIRLIIVVLVLALASCGTLSEPVAEQSESTIVSSTWNAEGVVVPSELQAAEFLSAMRRIAPNIKMEPHIIVRTGTYICMALYDDKESGRRTAQWQAQERFGVDWNQAAEIVKAVQLTLCTTPEFYP